MSFHPGLGAQFQIVCDEVRIADTSPHLLVFHFFLALPAELRNLVYTFCFSTAYHSINDTVGAHARRILAAEVDHKPPVPDVVRTTPSILLVCRQIYDEAKRVLGQQPFVMRHGLLGFTLDSLISESTFRGLKHIVILDNGHAPMACAGSFVGHKNLVTAMVLWLRDHNHQLESVELHFTDKELHTHLDNCWTLPDCHIRPWTEYIHHAWGLVRGVKRVSIYGWFPDGRKTDIIRLMQSPVSPFLRIPKHLLEAIVTQSTSFNHISHSINQDNDPRALRTPRSDVEISLPNVFRIHRELAFAASHILRQPPLVLDLVHPPASNRTDLFRYISPATLRSIPSIAIVLRHRAWLSILDDLESAMTPGHSLKTLYIRLDDDQRLPTHPTSSGIARVYPDYGITTKLEAVLRIPGIQRLQFGGDLDGPEVTRFVAETLSKRLGPTWQGGRLKRRRRE